MRLNALLRYILYIHLLALVSCKVSSEKEVGSETVKEVMDAVVTRLYAQLTPAQLDTISETFIKGFLTAGEKEILASRFWNFEVNQPVTVSLMRHEKQETVPFWLEESGFVNTGKFVKNDHYTYEVWQKDFEAGKVNLGVNGFDKHRPVYFITVAPKGKPQEELKISNVFPENQQFEKCRVGAFTYHDWDELRLTEVPRELEGQVLFTTVRGRAREAHLVKAFRQTLHPSTTVPDQILLSWSGSPESSMDIQWRTSPSVKEGLVKYWKRGASDTLTTKAGVFEMEDRLLQNDRYVNRFTATLTGLSPGVSYTYKVGSDKGGWSDIRSFETQSKGPEGAFSFIWFGDTHFSPHFGDMARQTLARHPQVAFYQIAGDLVTTGLYRDDWDKLFYNAGSIFSYKPLMPVPGNHDSQDGLGAWMYKEMFSLPENGPEKNPSEMTYSYKYRNALFLMIDATLPIDNQTAWIEKQLSESKEKWKFVMFHFPPYNFEEDYSEIRKKWCSLFDKYHVDMVMGGHVHYYMRTKPMYKEKPVLRPADGTIYTISISIPATHDPWPDEDYAVVRRKSGPLYQHISIDGNTLVYQSLDSAGVAFDELRIVK